MDAVPARPQWGRPLAWSLGASAAALMVSRGHCDAAAQFGPDLPLLWT